jgi:hypothetical protein
MYNLGFRSDRSVVRTGYPAGIFPQHPGPSYQDVLDSIVQAMAHMEHTGDIRRRDHHRIGFPSVRFTGEISLVKPMLVPLCFGYLVLKILT